MGDQTARLIDEALKKPVDLRAYERGFLKELAEEPWPTKTYHDERIGRHVTLIGPGYKAYALRKRKAKN